MLSNPEIAKILYEISEYLEMEDEPFRPRAYQRAARAIEAQDQKLINVYQKGGIKALKEIPGIGEGIAKKIEELLKTGKLTYFDKLKKKSPVDVSTLANIEGIGPKKIKTLYKKLNVRSLEDLEKAAKAHKIRELEGFGEKSEENILKGIDFLKKGRGRILLGHILPQVNDLKARFKKLKQVRQVEVAGSVRRMKETVGDIDIQVSSDSPQKVMDFFVSLPEMLDVYGKGKTKSSARLSLGIDMDLRVVPQESFGAALQYFTGSKDHNIALRKIAQKKGLKLNEYGLFEQNKKLKIKNKKDLRIAGRTEEKIYEKLGLEWIEPELRENTGELEAAEKGNLPKLIPYGSLKGDLEVHTSWSDGALSISEMAKAALGLGLEYLLVTDHTKSLHVAKGLDEKRLTLQAKEIDSLNREFEKQEINFRVLKGSEVDILKNGELDIEDEVLAKLDIVLGSIHSYFNLSQEEETQRLIRAMENPHIDIIAHPTGRVIGRREAYQLDMDKIFKVAKQTGTILEINAYPDRLDLKDVYVKEAVSRGIKLTINSDAHHPSHLNYLNLGVAVARRGWAEKQDILNTFSVEKLLDSVPKHA